MAFELPTDLIRQVQIAVRNDAGLSHYDPDDPTLPSLPSFDASIFGLDPSTPAYLRCKNCKGKLLRGVQSVICIYCGKQQLNKDLPPDPISFTSTFGYQWLLQSLDLDQSETVGPATEEYESNRGHVTPKQETSLHDLLDLQITWPDELERPETSVTNKASEQRSSSLNFNEADLDNVFSGPKRYLASDASVETVTPKQLDSTESKVSGSVQENITFFSGVPSADSGFERPSEDNRGDSFSGWAADFQSENKHEGSNSFDPFVGSSVDLSSHIDSVFGAGKEEKTGKIEDDLKPAPSMSLDWMQDDLWKNVDSKVSQQTAHFDSTAETKDGLAQKNIDNPGSVDVGWFEDNQWQTNITSEPRNNTIGGPDDPFDEWNDFASSTNAVDLSGNAPKNTDYEKAVLSEHTSEINLFNSTSNEPDNEFGSFSQPDFFSVSPVIHDGDAATNNILKDVYASDRSDNSENVKELPENGDVLKVSTQTTPPKDEVEILMSQMHDLSFMLESDLSVPSKLVSRSSTHQD